MNQDSSPAILLGKLSETQKQILNLKLGIRQQLDSKELKKIQDLCDEDTIEKLDCLIDPKESVLENLD